MTFAILRSLHEIIGHAIDEVERVYAAHADDARSTPQSKRSSPTPVSPSTPGTYASDAGGAGAPLYTPPNRPTCLNSTPNSAVYASPPPSPLVATSGSPLSPKDVPSSKGQNLDFPSLDTPHDSSSLSEALTTHPSVLAAIQRIVAATGQLEAMVQTPFLTLCGAAMAYHLPSCMRLLEASHVVEILKEAGPEGLSVHSISEKNGVSPSKLAHIMRLLATHHFLRETSPDVFALNRLSSLLDSGKTFEQIKKFEHEGRPELKYTDSNGIAAFVGLCTDEIQKSAAYLTETYYLSPSASTRAGCDPVRSPFCVAFDTVQSGTDFFGWLEGEAYKLSYGKRSADHQRQSAPPPPPHALPPARGLSERHGGYDEAANTLRPTENKCKGDQAIYMRTGGVGDRQGQGHTRKKRIAEPADPATAEAPRAPNPNRFRLERFGKAMSGTEGWEVPGAVLNGFEWASLPPGSIVVDVGGGIGSTTMVLATAFSEQHLPETGDRGLQFVIQDRAVVCEMGEKAWKAKCPELLGTAVKFQEHDFFTTQPIKDAAVFLLRVVLHDWPNDFAKKILLRLREAASPQTKLLIADFILPLACPDDTSGVLDGVEGAESVLAPAPLLPNLGKASANVYWMDLTMQVVFNSQERTLREMVTLALSTGWKIIKVTKTPGSLFGYLVAIPIDIPEPAQEIPNEALRDAVPHSSCALSSSTGSSALAHRVNELEEEYSELIQRTSSRCGTPTFGSHTRLSSASETISRFNGSGIHSKAMGRSFSSSAAPTRSPPGLRQALPSSSSTGVIRKKKPSPLSVQSPTIQLHGSPTPAQSPRRVPSVLTSPRTESIRPPQTPGPTSGAPRIISRRMSLANLRSPYETYSTMGPPPPLPGALQMARGTLSPSARRPVTRRASQLEGFREPVPPLPSLIPVRAGSGLGAGALKSPGLSSPSSSTTSHRPRLAVSPIPPTVIPSPTHPRLARRASSMQLPRAVLRRRAGTVGVDSLVSTGTVLRFDSPARGDPECGAAGVIPAPGLLQAAAPISSGSPNRQSLSGE